MVQQIDQVLAGRVALEHASQGHKAAVVLDLLRRRLDQPYRADLHRTQRRCRNELQAAGGLYGDAAIERQQLALERAGRRVERHALVQEAGKVRWHRRCAATLRLRRPLDANLGEQGRVGIGGRAYVDRLRAVDEAEMREADARAMVRHRDAPPLLHDDARRAAVLALDQQQRHLQWLRGPCYFCSIGHT